MIPTLLRPKSLQNIVGNSSVIETFKKQILTDTVPHFMIFSGQIGSGKTTFARIFSRILQETVDSRKQNLEHISTDDIKKFEIKEINASDKNGVDDIRALIVNSSYMPIGKSKHRIFILDEAHQLTKASQECLLSFIEELPRHIYIMFCTSTISKILASLRRRAYIVDINLLSNKEIRALLEKSIQKLHEHNINTENISMEKFEKYLIDNNIYAPGLILQALEKYTMSNSLVTIDDEKNNEMITLCRAIASGHIQNTLAFFKEENSKSIDFMACKNCVIAYLKKVLLGSTDEKAIKIARAIKVLVDSSENNFDILASFVLACEKIRPVSISKT